MYQKRASTEEWGWKRDALARCRYIEVPMWEALTTLESEAGVSGIAAGEAKPISLL
jgi:hypothetical protein